MPAQARQQYAVVVLGDLGRSPRMQYHALSLANISSDSHVRVAAVRKLHHDANSAVRGAAVQVDFIGFGGERCIDDVESHPRITRRVLSQPFARAPRALYALWAPLKVLWQMLQLLYLLLLVIPRPRAFLVQNPPSIPTLAIVWLASRLRGSRMIIDWHNFGYTVLALTRPGSRFGVVSVARTYEHAFARLADGHLCVTAAMREWLRENWGVTATVVYDRAPAWFKTTPLPERHALFTRLADSLPSAVSFYATRRCAKFRSNTLPDGAAVPAGQTLQVREETLFTEKVAVVAAEGGDGSATQVFERARASRPALIMSSTSWTEDEDFSILLHALVTLDEVMMREPTQFPDLVVIVTGKGPLRQHYERQIAAMRLQRVQIRTLWLEAADYPKLLGAADLGVCLHTSTSGLDLPMKVVDMFGAGLPVCAVNFRCLSELVRNDENGIVFDTSEQLATALERLLRGFPGAPAKGELDRLRDGVRAFQGIRWQDNWDATARPLFV